MKKDKYNKPKQREIIKIIKPDKTTEKHLYRIAKYDIIRDFYLDDKYENVIKHASEFLICFPTDPGVRMMRAKAYRALGRYEEAIKDYKGNIKFDKGKTSIISLFYLYMQLGRYKDAYKTLYNIEPTDFNNRRTKKCSQLILRKQLGLNYTLPEGADMVAKQLYSYDEEVAIEHIKTHSDEEYSKKNGKSYFNIKLDVDNLYKIVKESIKEANKAIMNDYLDVYFFSIFNVGYDLLDTPCNYVRVVVEPGTNNIITLYPTNDVGSHPTNSLKCEYEKLFKEEQKVKKISRIEKFNKKYKIV